jgi:hypothetical protein
MEARDGLLLQKVNKSAFQGFKVATCNVRRGAVPLYSLGTWHFYKLK